MKMKKLVGALPALLLAGSMGLSLPARAADGSGDGFDKVAFDKNMQVAEELLDGKPLLCVHKAVASASANVSAVERLVSIADVIVSMSGGDGGASQFNVGPLKGENLRGDACSIELKSKVVNAEAGPALGRLGTNWETGTIEVSYDSGLKYGVSLTQSILSQPSFAVSVSGNVVTLKTLDLVLVAEKMEPQVDQIQMRPLKLISAQVGPLACRLK